MIKTLSVTLLCLLCSWSIPAQQITERFDEWRIDVLESAAGLKLQEVLTTDYDADWNVIQNRRVSGWMATRAMPSKSSSLPERMTIEDLPAMFFNVPWDFRRTRPIEGNRIQGAIGFELHAEADRAIRGELWYDNRSGQLIETHMEFDGKELPRITVCYIDARIDSMIIRSVPEAGMRSAAFREAIFKY